MTFDLAAVRAFEHAGWQAAAGEYDATFAHASARFAEALLDAAGVGRAVRVLDIGCGTGGGVTAGIDIAFCVAAEIAGCAAAEAIQLGVEYDPQPPFAAGSPEKAPPAVRESVLARAAARQQDRAERVARATAAL